MNKYTITQFRKDYPDDDACLDKIFKLRFTNLVCPDCENDKPFVRVKHRRSYQCPCCGFQVYPTKDTVFEKTTTPLVYWFWAIYMQSTTRNGVAAKEFERQFNICYKTALRMAHQIKLLMANKNTSPLTGVVEVDETYVGGKMKYKHKSVRAAYIAEGKSSVDNKVGIMGFLERGKSVRLEIMGDEKTFKERVRAHVDKNSLLITDSHSSYKGLDKEYKQHETINHVEDEYVRGNFHTNSIEGFFSQLKRTIKGTHIHVSEKHLQKYVDEVAFRWINKDKQDIMFEIILNQVV
jgi:transposase